MNVLGHLIQDDNGIRAAWNSLNPKLWRAFYANCRCTNWKKLGQRRRCNLIFRVVDPIIAHGVGAWPPQHRISLDMNVLQRRMYGMAVGLYPEADESPKDFNTRVARTVRPLIESTGWWSKKWFQKATS